MNQILYFLLFAFNFALFFEDKTRWWNGCAAFLLAADIIINYLK